MLNLLRSIFPFGSGDYMAGGDREVRELYGPGACVAYIRLRGRSLLKRVEGEQYGWVKRVI